MKNTKLMAILMTVATVPAVSAYYDTYGAWHDDIITESVEATKQLGTDVLDVATGGRYSDTPEDRKARIEAERKLEDKRMAAEEKKEKARRQYQEKQEKIRRKKEDRKLQKRMKE